MRGVYPWRGAPQTERRQRRSRVRRQAPAQATARASPRDAPLFRVPRFQEKSFVYCSWLCLSIIPPFGNISRGVLCLQKTRGPTRRETPRPRHEKTPKLQVRRETKEKNCSCRRKRETIFFSVFCNRGLQERETILRKRLPREA